MQGSAHVLLVEMRRVNGNSGRGKETSNIVSRETRLDGLYCQVRLLKNVHVVFVKINNGGDKGNNAEVVHSVILG